MIRKLAWLSAKAYAQEFNKSHNDRAKMYYGYQLFYSEVFKIPLILLIGIILGILLEITIVTLSFSILRYFTGGYHAESWKQCLIETLSIFTLGAALTHFISNDNILWLILSGILIGILLQCFTLTVIGNKLLSKLSILFK